MEQITAKDYLALAKTQVLPILDVRSESEFANGHIPDSANFPILNDNERHQVGLTYKNEGQDRAIALGQGLVAPFKDARISKWIDFLAKQEHPIVSCWRGGLRSRLSQQWLVEKGQRATRLVGGYKALRSLLMQELSKPYRGAVVMGLTGSGKTAFLNSLPAPLVPLDLEGIAAHRGSAFGNFTSQPSTQYFENALGLFLARARENFIVAEDESRAIGRIYIDEKFWVLHRNQPGVFLEIPLRDRVKNIFELYLREDLKFTTLEKLQERYQNNLDSIAKKLGGLSHQKISKSLQKAFSVGEPLDFEAHAKWIEPLLTEYYDPRYLYALERSGRKPVFKGSPENAKNYLIRACFQS